MRPSEIEHPFRVPDTHPYVAELRIDPADHRRITRIIDERPELRLLGTLDQQPDEWIMLVGCASRRVREQFEDWIAD